MNDIAALDQAAQAELARIQALPTLTLKDKLAIEPQYAAELDPMARRTTMDETCLGYTEAQARVEASRCMKCKKPFCTAACPIGMPIPQYLERVAEGDFQGAIDIIRATSRIPSICSRGCPHEKQCQSNCAMGKSLKDPNKGLHLGNMERFCADYEREHLGGKKALPVAPETGKKVAVIGGGISGLAATEAFVYALAWRDVERRCLLIVEGAAGLHAAGAGGLESDAGLGDKAREEKLIRLYDDFLPGGSKYACCSRPYHVDDTIFGSIAYQIYLQNGDRRCLAEGARYADTQWTPPCEGTLKERHAAPLEVQQGFWDKGYTPQTRLWIDDMYMIIAIQSQAYRATHDRKYIDRTAREMCLYLDELQLKDGPAKGLFYHAPDVHYVWGRGDGWMAGGMAMVLKYLPEDSEYRPRIMKGYRDMMAALLKYQRADGKWSQLVIEPENPKNWWESSCTAMFAYAFITGVRRGWLCPKAYGPAARKAWIALCDSLDEHANVPQTCCGTGKRDDHQYYFDRIRVHGDPHGQVPMPWCASALME